VLEQLAAFVRLRREQNFILYEVIPLSGVGWQPGPAVGGRRPKLRPNQQDKIVTMVSTGTKTAADAARLFNVHPATVSRLLASAGAQRV
jgi:hypothetical protein